MRRALRHRKGQREIGVAGRRFTAAGRDPVFVDVQNLYDRQNLAGFANNTVIFCMPGSTGACRTATGPRDVMRITAAP